MSDKPIIFNAAMVRALLEGGKGFCGRKTQTRRVMKPQPFKEPIQDEETGEWGHVEYDYKRNANGYCEPYDEFWLPLAGLKYQIGMRLWVRETFSGLDLLRGHLPLDWPLSPIWYWADGNPVHNDWTRPKPSIHMPRWASRLTLIVTDVRVQRLQDISEDDAIAEGVALERYVPVSDSAGMHASGEAEPTDPVEEYRDLWNTIYGPDAWKANPWVSAITFTVHHCNIDQMARAA